MYYLHIKALKTCPLGKVFILALSPFLPSIIRADYICNNLKETSFTFSPLHHVLFSDLVWFVRLVLIRIISTSVLERHFKGNLLDPPFPPLTPTNTLTHTNYMNEEEIGERGKEWRNGAVWRVFFFFFQSAEAAGGFYLAAWPPSLSFSFPLSRCMCVCVCPPHSASQPHCVTSLPPSHPIGKRNWRRDKKKEDKGDEVRKWGWNKGGEEERRGGGLEGERWKRGKLEGAGGRGD